jgi:Ca2+-binding RTX toxin-like protein
MAASSINGNDGLDTLAFAEDGVAITDDKFLGNISNVEVLQTADGTNFIQIGTNAESSGLESIIGGADSDTFDAAEFNSDIAIDAGDGDDSITLQNSARVATSTIEGGLGNDTLSIWEAGALADEDLINVTGIENLQAAESESSSIVLGQIAKAAGIQAVVAGIDNDILDARDFSGTLVLDGGEGDDHFFVSAGFDLRQKVVIGGIGSDTLSFTTNQLSVTDADFVGVDAVEYFKTANGNNRVVLGSSAQSAGISTIEGGTGRDTLSVAGFGSDVTLIGGAEKSSLVGGSGNDSLFGNNGNDVLNGGDGIDTMVGGLGDDTYYIGDDGDWAIEGVDSGNNLLIVDQEVELFNTVSGGGATTFTIQGLDSIAGTNGDDSITGNTSSLNNAGQVMKTTSLNDTIDGGDGNDTIAGGRGKDSILGGNNNDSILGEEGNDALRGDDGNDTILAGDGNDSVVGGDGNDSLLAGAGNDTLFGEAGNDTLKADATGSATLDGGTDDDTFQFSSAAQIAASSIVGGAGTGDEIVLTKGSIFSDADFSKVSGVEIFDASVQEASRVSLGGNALRAGIAILIGSDNNADFLSAAQYTSEQITITAGSGSTQDTLVAGSGRNKSSLVGNAGANYFEVGLASLLGNHTIDGGAGIDSLSIERIAYGEGGTSDSSDIEDSLIGGDQLFTDSLFKYTSNIDAIYYNNRYFNSLVLGDDFASIFGSNQTASIFSAEDTYPDLINDDASDYIDLSRITSKKVYLDVNHERFGATIIGGQDENTLVGGRKSTADDLFIFQNANWLVNSKIVGGGGNDTLRVGGNVQDINSSNFDIDIDVLDITGAGNKITLSGNSGITTIIGGSGPNTLDASSYDLGNKTLAWDMRRSIGGDSLLGGIQGNLFQLKNDANLQNSIITGNTGEDTIQIVSGAETLGDAVFDNTSNAEVLMLGSAANGNNITLGSIAEGVGISTVIGGTARETIDASAYAAAIYIDASASSGARLQGSSTSNANILIGGSLGGNEFEIGDLGSNTIVGGSGGLDTLTFVSANTVINDTDDTDGKIGGSSAALSNIGVLRFLGDNNDITLGKDALAAGILTLVGGEGGDLGSNFDTSRYNTVGVLFQITDQFYLRNSNITGSLGVDTLKFSRDGVSVTDEIVTNLSNIDIIQTANGNNRFLFDNDYLTAGIETIIGGTGRDTIDMADIGLYTPATDDDIITMDLSAGSGYTLISTAQNFAFAKVIGSATNEGSVIIDGLILTDEDFEHMYQGNIGSLFMRVGSDNFVTLGENALASGLDILTMSSGDDIIDASGFAGTLAINGGDGDDIVRTSFAALSNLTYTGGGGVDTLRLTGAEARSFTSLAGNFEALALNAGNNFVILANDASLSAIHGGTGIDTISMLSNTTGINFVMNAARLGNTAGFASLDGGSGNDTLTVHNVLTPFLDTQFARVGSVSWAEDIGAIENFVTENAGGESYTFGTTAYAAGIQNVYVHNGDILDASNFFDLAGDPATDRALNFVFATAGDAAAADITGSGANANDTLTLTDDDQTVDNATFANKTSVETLVLANGTNTVTLNANAAAAGIEVVVGGAGNDALTFDTTLQTALILNGGAQTTFDSAIISNAGATFGDGYFEDWSSVERLTTANGNNNITLGVNAVTAGIATITGGTGNDTFNASAYTIAATLIGGDGNDSMLSGSTSDSLTGGAGDDTFYGGAGNDFISGGDDADFICGASTLTGGSNEIDTLTGDAGNDTFVLGDATNAYYNTATNAGDYALIRDFDAANDQLQLRDLTGGANPNGGYLFGAAIYGAIGGANSYLYVDTDASNTVNTGDNLVAAISSSVALTTADLTNPARVSII